MNDSLTTKVNGAPLGIIKPKMAPCCGGCHFSDPLPQDLKMIICKGLPPQMVVVGVTAQGPQLMPCYPNLPRGNPGCALHRERGLPDGERSN